MNLVCSTRRGAACRSPLLPTIGLAALCLVACGGSEDSQGNVTGLAGRWSGACATVEMAEARTRGLQSQRMVAAIGAGSTAERLLIAHSTLLYPTADCPGAPRVQLDWPQRTLESIGGRVLSSGETVDLTRMTAAAGAVAATVTVPAGVDALALRNVAYCAAQSIDGPRLYVAIGGGLCPKLLSITNDQPLHESANDWNDLLWHAGDQFRLGQVYSAAVDGHPSLLSNIAFRRAP